MLADLTPQHYLKAFPIKVILLTAVIVVLLMPTTLKRNNIWKNEIILLEDVILKSPKKGRPYYELGNVYYRKELAEPAIKQYLSYMYIRRNPEEWDLYANLGQAYALLGSYDKAISLYQHAIQLNPADADLYYILGLAYWKKGDRLKAHENYQRAIKLESASDELHVNIGLAYLSMKMVPEAQKEFQAALSINPANGEAARYLNFIGNK